MSDAGASRRDSGTDAEGGGGVDAPDSYHITVERDAPPPAAAAAAAVGPGGGGGSSGSMLPTLPVSRGRAGSGRKSDTVVSVGTRGTADGPDDDGDFGSRRSSHRQFTPVASSGRPSHTSSRAGSNDDVLLSPGAISLPGAVNDEDDQPDLEQQAYDHAYADESKADTEGDPDEGAGTGIAYFDEGQMVAGEHKSDYEHLQDEGGYSETKVEYDDLDGDAADGDAADGDGADGKSPKKHKKKKHKEKKLSKKERKAIAARERMEDERKRALAGQLLTRTAFTYGAWLDPDDPNKKKTIEAAKERAWRARQKRSDEDDRLLKAVGRYKYCNIMFKREHPWIVTGVGWLIILAWRIVTIMDWVTDIWAYQNVNRFASGYGFFLLLLLGTPFVMAGIGVFNVVVREIPKFLERNKIVLADTNTMIWTYILFAPLWVFLLDVFLNIRFAVTSVTGHYFRAFDRMRRVTLIFVGIGVTSVVQMQIMTVGIDGVKDQVLTTALYVSLLNLAINLTWMSSQISRQHRPWHKWIVDSFRAGLSHIPNLDDVRDGVKRLEYVSGLNHFSEIQTITDVILDAGKNCKLEDLKIQRCLVEQRGSHALSTLIAGNTTLLSLRLGHNQIDSEGLKHLVTGSESNTTLKRLEVDSNIITDDGVAYLAGRMRAANSGGKGCRLEAVNLRWNDIRKDGTHSIALALKYDRCSLTYLDLSYNPLGIAGAEALAKGLPTNTKLKTLILDNANIVEEGAAAIAQGVTQNKGLETLSFSGNRCGDVGASSFWEVLEQNKTLKKLSLLGLDMSDSAAKILAENLELNQTLTYIDVSFNHMSPALIEEFAEAQLNMPELKYLLLGNNSLTRDGFRRRFKANRDLIALTLGIDPRLRFKPFPK